MKKRCLLLFVFLLSVMRVYGHGIEENAAKTIPWPIWDVVGYGAALFAVLIFVMVQFNKVMKSKMKLFVYSLVVLSVGFVTLYLIITTVHLNIISPTGGPVHWHADYEVWTCGEELKLVDPKFPSNKVGNPVLHDHGDNRLHVEGVITEMAEASLHSFFNIVGGELTATSLGFSTNEKYVFYENGNLCPSGNPGTLYVFVNGKQVDDFPEYVLAPHEIVPPGDAIKLIFTDEAVEDIDPSTRGMKEGTKI